MTTLEQHITERPEMPRPFNPFTPEAIAWHRAMQWWVDTKAHLEREVHCHVDPADNRPRVAAKILDDSAGLYVMDAPKPAKRPAWAADPDYMARKKRESRARATEAKKCHDCAEMAVEGRSRCERCLLRTANARNKKRGVVLYRSERLVLIREGLAQRKGVAA